MERDCFYNELKYVRDYACKAAGLDSEIAGWKTAVDAMTKQLADAQATVEALQAQLPAEMQGCTILFKECEKGHGRLVATNWRDHGCQTCEVEALQAHQQLHDRIFERQKCLLAHYVTTIREAVRRLHNSTHSAEQPEPYESRTPVIAAFLEEALGVNAEEVEKESANLKQQVEALQRERDEANSHVKFLGATKQANGSFCLDMKKYHAGHRCGRHRDDPWQGIDTEIDCFVCLKQALDAEREKVARLEAAANYYKQPSKNGGVYSVSGGHIGNLMDWCKDNLKHCKFSGPDEDNLDLDLVQTAQQIPQLKTELSQLQALVRALVAKLDESDKASQGIFIAAAMHGIRYSGPSYADELQALKAATLDATTPATTKT